MAQETDVLILAVGLGLFIWALPYVEPLLQTIKTRFHGPPESDPD